MLDRRQKKTREAIFRALQKLMERKQFGSITVQEIIEEADIGRSTFYAHFKTRDDLLRSLCSSIFEHVFTDLLPQEDDAADLQNLDLKLGHILYHLKENEINIKAIINTDNEGLFMNYFRQYLATLFARYVPAFSKNVPDDFLIRHLVGSFAETVKWWVDRQMLPAPETAAHFYIAFISQ